ncbi:EAL domain-containing protein [Sulfuricurvum sp.]|uniref:EAL domain-containing protein n=1 Tax=Sulfuricurvum sp. TaxID=2025608 RepID=UPI003C5CCBF2
MNTLKLFFTTIKGQLVIGIVLLHSALMGMFVYDLIQRESRFLREQSLSKAEELTRLIGSSASLSLLNNDIVGLHELVAQVEHLPDVETVFILDKNHRVRASNDAASFNRTITDAWSIHLHKELENVHMNFIQKRHEGIVDTLIPIKVGENTIGYARMLTTTATIDREIERLLSKGIMYIFIAMIVGGILSWLIVRRLTAHLTLLSAAAARIAQNNYDIALPSFLGNDEISKMGRAFSLMIDSINRHIRELESMLFKVKAAEAMERERSQESERYQKALSDWSKNRYETSEIAIRKATEISAHTLGIERVSVWLLTPDQSTIVCQDMYSAGDDLHYAGTVLEKKDFPHYFHALVQGEMMAVNDAQIDSRTSEFTESYLKPSDIRSMLDMPISQDGKVIGVVCYEHVGSLRTWKPEIQEFVITIANAIALSIEIDRRKKMEQTMAYKAHHDELTHLYNRSLFVDRLEHAIHKAKRSGDQLAVLFIDLDRFKEINDSLGHAMGDKVLITIAKRLSDHLRDIDTIARLGGDEFTLIIEDVDDIQKVNQIAGKLVSVLQEPIFIDEHQLYVTSSIGISIYPLDGESAQNLLSNADAAMYKAKEEGRNSYQYYTQELTLRAFERVAMETSLRHALENNEFLLYYQPKTDGESERLIGMEALIRWNHPEMGMVSPSKFIPIAEETGLIVLIDHFVMKKVMEQVVQWRNNGFNPGVVSLNVARKELLQEKFADKVKSMLVQSGCKAEWIELEVTEGDIMKKPEQSIGVLKELKKLGFALAIDDFGTGYSSLSYLKRLPLDILKIDQSFVRGLPEDTEDAAIVRSIIALAESMGMNVIAEGVETLEQKNFLVENGCRLIQGYFYGRPMSVTQMRDLLSDSRV